MTNHVDVLVNNAGTVSSRFMTSEDGIELQFAVNHLAPFLLTHELLPLILAAPHGKIITVSSGSHFGARLNFSDLQMRRRYSSLGQYRRVKLCNVLFTAELNRRLAPDSPARAYAVDPGLVQTDIGLKGTSGIERFAWKLHMKSGTTPDVPAACILYLATDQSIPARDCIYWRDSKPKSPNPYAMDEDAGKLLWEASERYCRIAGNDKS
jgi:NAD(P)-dependent dehydrogenase (short-subunit alcohol dehydrogenase family)